MGTAARPRILIIDDDKAILILVRSILEPKGYEVMIAEEGEEGLMVFAEYPADLVITDILMPGMDGISFIRELRKLHPEVKIIALSGGGMTLSARTSLSVAEKMGVYGKMAKPFTPQQLLAAVKEVLG